MDGQRQRQDGDAENQLDHDGGQGEGRDVVGEELEELGLVAFHAPEFLDIRQRLEDVIPVEELQA